LASVCQNSFRLALLVDDLGAIVCVKVEIATGGLWMEAVEVAEGRNLAA